MDPNLTHQGLKSAIRQRNISLALSGVLMLTNLTLSVCLLNKVEKTIIVPASLQRSVEFKGTEMSLAYLEEMTIFFMNLLLELTPQNIEYKSRHLLKYVEPSAYHNLENYFKEEIEKHKKYNLATVFTLLEIKLTPNTLSAEIRGVLSGKFVEDGVHQQAVNYRISYKNANGRLLITEFIKL